MNYKELSNSYKTTEHFKDRLRERFNVFNNQLQWSQTFFNSQPRLVNEIDNVQKWSNGNIVVVTDVKDHAYVTTYSISNNVILDTASFAKFQKVANDLIEKKKKATVKEISAIKKSLVTKLSDIDNSLKLVSDTNLSIQSELDELHGYEERIASFMEIVIVE